MLKLSNHNIIETSYDVSLEAQNATLFGIGNGYFGIRGSFEEFGDVNIQGCYVRGVFDEIIENPNAISTNMYMKRFYFNEDKLKQFEYEDSCINIADFLAIRIFIDGKEVRPWNCSISSYKRFIDYRDGSLNRSITYCDETGNKTQIVFKRLASFDNDHYILQEAKIKKLNHSLPIAVEIGTDTLVKTQGQKKSKANLLSSDKRGISIHYSFGDKYGIEGESKTVASFPEAVYGGNGSYDGFFFERFNLDSKEGTIHKVTSFIASIDKNKELDGYDYASLYEKHRISYLKSWDKVDMAVEGNSHVDAYLRYSLFQSLIGGDRHSSIHSLSAKNLTSEKYNQFVWWDAEVYQLPFYFETEPEIARNALLYRFNRLDEAKKIAINDGYKGAKFAFCSSVKGDENVWIYARHPFLQIHIDADIAYGFLSYLDSTGDYSFYEKYGLPVTEEIMRYYLSRSELANGRYEIKNVTGTDEHHDYVNNDAYTNYLVHYVGNRFLVLADKLGYPVKERNELERYLDRLYLPPANEKGIIPQFDGYFSLRKDLPLVNGKSPGFQMKQNGLYHLSQIIKQPDVLLLYSYCDIGLNDGLKENYLFYKKKCEASSSLTYPVHGLCAIDNYDYKTFEECVEACGEMDFKDIYGGAYQGIHAGALAGTRILFTKGLAGIKAKEDGLHISPKYDKEYGDVSFDYVYRGSNIKCRLTPKGLYVEPDKEISIVANGKTISVQKGEKTLVKRVGK